ncbi:MAG: hypothetical protein WDA26_14450 [Pusillimonas sp.]
MKNKSLNPLRSLVEFWEIQPKGVLGWNAHKTRGGLFKDLAKEISKRLEIKEAVISSVWYAKVPEIPQELLSAMKKQGMNPEKVADVYKKYYYDNVTKPAEDRKKLAELKKLEAEERIRIAKEEKNKKFLAEWS